MFISDERLHILDYDHRTTDPSGIASNVDNVMVMIRVYAYKLVDSACPSQFAKLIDKTSGRASQTNDISINVDHIGSRGVNLNASGKRDVCEEEMVRSH
jgi:hypothetical protein